MTIYLQTDRVTLHHGRAEDVYPTLDPGFSLAILDGPYGIGKDEWDRMGTDGLAEWYRPHLEAVSALMAPSASLYLWNTAEGWARLDPVVRGLGWKFLRLIVWDKVISPAMLRDGAFQDVIEVCGLYTQGAPPTTGIKDAARTNARGTPCWIGNVWRMSSVDARWREERLRDGTEAGRTAVDPERPAPLHPCQKPLLFADRMIRASSRPGDRVLAPFGGTCREALACHRLPADEARSCVTIEMHQKYLDAVRGCFALDLRPRRREQVGLFGSEP